MARWPFRYSPAEVAEVHALHAQGLGRPTIANRTGIPQGSLQVYFQRFAAGDLVVEPDAVVYRGQRFATGAPALPVEQFRESAAEARIAALEAQIERLTAENPAPPSPPVECAYQPGEEADPANLWREAEQRNTSNIARCLDSTRFTAKFGDEAIGLTFVADQHIDANGTCDLARMRADAEQIASTPGLYAILGGDGINNHIKHRAAMVNSRSNPSEQYRLYDYYLQLLRDSLLVVICGNHDDWSTAFAGVDGVGWLAERHKLHYARHEARVSLSVGATEYAVAVRHQYRYNSSLNLLHTVKRWWDQGEEPFDVGVICHHHVGAIEQFRRHGRERWAARPGSYQVFDEHGAQYGYAVTWPTCPTFIFSPDRRHVVGFTDLSDAIRHLRIMRQE